MTDERRSRFLDALLREGGISSLLPDVPELSSDDALQVADEVVQLGWVAGEVSRSGSGDAYLITDLRITESGQRAARELRLRRASRSGGLRGEGLLDQSIGARKARRAQFLGCLYSLSGGSESYKVDYADIGGRLEWPRDEAEDVAKYLENEGLLRYWTEEGAVGLTHQGIKEYEQLVEDPDKPTRHFPAHSLTIFGDVHGQIALGATNISQAQTTTVLNRLPELRQFLVDYATALADEPLPDLSDVRTAETLLAVIEAQIDHPNPNEALMKNGLSVLRELAIGAGASGVWAGLAEVARHLLH